MLEIIRTNTILYCKNWSATVDFYGRVLELPIAFQSAWFVEFEIHTGSYLSVADEKRATIKSASGLGITLAWQTKDIERVHRSLLEKDVAVSDIRTRWGAHVCYLRDPEGNRIELWQPLAE